MSRGGTVPSRNGTVRVGPQSLVAAMPLKRQMSAVTTPVGCENVVCGTGAWSFQSQAWFRAIVMKSCHR